MQEESPGFQLTGGHAADLSQKERGTGREKEGERGKDGKEREKEEESL